MKWSKNIFGLALAGMLLLTSCSVPQKVVRKAPASVPDSFLTTATDSVSMAALQINQFFTDTILLNLINEVLTNNFDQKIAAEQIKMAESVLRMRRAATLPSLNIAGTGAGTKYGKHTIEGVGNFDTNLSPNIDKSQQVNTSFTPNYWLGLDANWEVDLWGRLKNMKQAARERFLASQHGRDLMRAAVVTEVSALYFDLIALDLEVEILKENILLQQEALDIVLVQKEAGKATELAVQQFQAQLVNTQAVLVELQQNIVANENKLLLLCGRYDGKILRQSKIDLQGIEMMGKHGNPNQLLQFRPDIQMAWRELAATHADAKAARAAFFPSVSLSAYGAFNTFNSSFLFNPTSIGFQLLGNVVAPVFQRHQIRGQFNIANSAQEVAFLEYQKNVVGAFLEVKTVLSYIENSQRMLDLKKQEVTALTNGVETSSDLYMAGYANYLEIIAAQKSKLIADLDLIKAQRNQAIAMIQLYKSLGGGWL